MRERTSRPHPRSWRRRRRSGSALSSPPRRRALLHRLSAAALLVAALLLVAAPPGAEANPFWPWSKRAAPSECREEWQIVMCADIPPADAAARASCCAAHYKKPLPPTAAAQVAGAEAAMKGWLASVPRPDLEAPTRVRAASAAPQQQQHAKQLFSASHGMSLGGHGSGPVLDFKFHECTEQRWARVPTFSYDAAQRRTNVAVRPQPVPRLDYQTILRVKQQALADAPFQHRRLHDDLTWRGGAKRHSARQSNAFLHPGGYVGPGELAVMAARLASGAQPQSAAKESLLTGRGVPPKVYPGWSDRTETPPDGYGGPYPMQRFEADYGSRMPNTSHCPRNYPSGAPAELCGHVALVEVDAKMAYRYAMAYAATRDERFARQAVAITDAWARTNRVFGLRGRNGPLEAAWAGAAMARALEILRATWPNFGQSHLDAFLAWAYSVLLPQMHYYIDEATPLALKSGKRQVYGNWHASVADAYVAIGVLADNRALYDKGRALYRKTLHEYLKWGRGHAPGRLLGETTETLRDIYHTEFGLGSLVQVAETAWTQNEDLYQEADYALAAALELHARIINAFAAGDESKLPDGFKFFESMPKPPAECAWRWDIETQLWASYHSTKGHKCSDLKDGKKYLLGIKYLPTGFELGYNHYAGRLGMDLPEVRALLRANGVDFFEFSWGLATLTHAGSARELWAPGVRAHTLCGHGGGGNGGGRRLLEGGNGNATLAGAEAAAADGVWAAAATAAAAAAA